MKNKRKNIKQMYDEFIEAYVEYNDAYKAAMVVGVPDNKIDSLVAKWSKDPATLIAVKEKRIKKYEEEKVEAGWLIDELKQLYALAKQDDDKVNALKALDMLAKHVGLYANDKQGGDTPITVVIKNYADAEIE